MEKDKIETKIMPDAYGRNRPHTYIECDYCGKMFWRPTKNILRGQHNYCCHDCHGAAQRKVVIVKCLYCGKEFGKNPSKVKKYNFCCRKCKDMAQRIENNMKEIQPGHYKTGKHCYREKALKSLERKCDRCGYNEYEEILQVHHIDGNRDNNNINNLIILCPNCHALCTKGILVSADII